MDVDSPTRFKRRIVVSPAKERIGRTTNQVSLPFVYFGELMLNGAFVLADCQTRKLQQTAKKAFAAGQPLPEKAKMPIFAADITTEGIHLYDGMKATATEIPEGIPKPKKKKKKSKKASSS